jgi:hypothetical protein
VPDSERPSRPDLCKQEKAELKKLVHRFVRTIAEIVREDDRRPSVKSPTVDGICVIVKPIAPSTNFASLRSVLPSSTRATCAEVSEHLNTCAAARNEHQRLKLMQIGPILHARILVGLEA